MQRLEKEFSALKGRGGEARTQAYDKGKAEAINQILGVADNFERAAGAISAETDGERAVVAYYKDAYDNMMKCLEGLGLAEVETVRMEGGGGADQCQSSGFVSGARSVCFEVVLLAQAVRLPKRFAIGRSGFVFFGM